MEFKIIKQEKNNLFDREDVSFTATQTGSTPTRQEVKNLISAKTGKKTETIAVINIHSEFGKAEIKGTAHIYKSKEDLEKKELKYIVKRNAQKPAKKIEEEAPVATEKKPVEDVKSETTEEKKEEAKE